MRVLLTGGTGFIGSAVLRTLLGNGHDVVAVVRSEQSARAVSAVGAVPAIGDLTDRRWLADRLHHVDGAVHAAASDDGNDAARDAALLGALSDAFSGTQKSYVHTGGVWVYGPGVAISEDSVENPPALTAARVNTERAVCAAAFTASLIQPGVVYGPGRGLVNLVAAGPLVGDGRQHWTTVHVDDLADLYLAALTRDGGGARRYIAVNGHCPSVREIVAAAGGDLAETSVRDVHERFGVELGDALLMDQQASGAAARRELGWVPTRPTLLEELSRR